jgi:class 3 adenylate cyclase/tetratricopeptide (TPR) repeat protein
VRCGKCGFDVPAGAKFCGECGNRLQVLCSGCGAEVLPNFKFCGECGTPVAGAVAARPQPTLPPPAPPVAPAGRVVTSGAAPVAPLPGSAVESELRLVTVLFADMQGFTPLSERHLPEEVTDVVNRCLEAMSKAVEQYGGRVDKYAGDNLMAVFGAPVAHEDDAERAVRAALEIHRAIGRLNADFEKELGEQITMRCGINTGQVLAGLVGGNAAHREYSVIGDAVNLAARLQSEAKAGGTLVGEETYRTIRHLFEFQPRPPFFVKGKKEKVKAYDVIGERAEPTSMEQAARATPLVGRQQELDWLQSHLQAVASGTGGRVIGLIGEAGVGKTRLLQELRARTAADPELSKLTWITGRCFSYSASIPLFFWTDLARSYFNLQPGDDEATVREKLRAGVIRYLPVAAGTGAREGVDEAVSETLYIFGEVLGVRFPHPALEQMDPDGKHHLLAKRMREMLAGRCREGPVLIAGDDLHWADPSSIALLEHVLPDVPNMQVAMLFISRPEWTLPWRGHSNFYQRQLGPLGTKEQEELLASLSTGLPLPDEISAHLLERTGGNPFFLEELFHYLVDSGRLVRGHDGWKQAAGGAELPASVQEVVLSRLDRLSPPVKRVLQVASVVGRSFAYDILKVVADAGPKLDDYLEELQRQEFIREKAVFPEWEYLFRHAITQEVAYQSLLAARRREIHRRAGEAIEQLYAGRLEEQLDVLAHHFRLSDRPEKALHYLGLAADRARSLFLNDEAVDYYRSALEVVAQLGGREEQRARLLEGMADALSPGGLQQKSEAERCYEEALGQCQDVRDRSRLAEKVGWVVHQQGRCSPSRAFLLEVLKQMRSEVEASPPGSDERLSATRIHLALARHALHLHIASMAARHVAAAAEEVERLPSSGLSRERRQVLAAFWGRKGRLSYHNGEAEEAQELGLKSLALAESVGDTGEVRYAYETVGRSLIALGRHGEARSYLTEGLALAEKMQDGWSIGDQCHALAMVAWFEDKKEEAHSWAQRAFTAAEAVTCNPFPVLLCAELQAAFARAKGQANFASTFWGRARNFFRTYQDYTYQTLATFRIAELARMTGRVERARECAAEMEQLMAETDDPRPPVYVHTLKGHLAADEGNWEEALAEAVQAEQAADAFREEYESRRTEALALVGRLRLRIAAHWRRADELTATGSSLLAHHRATALEPAHLLELGQVLEEMAGAWLSGGDPSAASHLLAEAAAVYARLGAPPLEQRIRSRIA